MKTIKTIFLFLILALPLNVIGQEEYQEIKVGETLTIQNPENYDYSHINFPKANFIIKKQGVANYKKLKGTEVVISEIISQNENENKVILKRKDGQKFFGSFASVSAHVDKAMAAGELTR